VSCLPDGPVVTSTTSYNARLFIVHPDGSHLLLDGEGRGAPVIQVPRPPTDNWWRESAYLNRSVPAELGLRATLLYCADVEPAAQTGTFVMEAHDRDWQPPAGLRWVASGEARALAGERYAQHGEKLPWTRPGWLAEVSRWVREQVPVEGDVEQVRSWFLSCILRASTPDGPVYLKAVPPPFAYEPELTTQLSREQPALVPEVLVVDRERGLLLMRGVDGARLDRFAPADEYLPRWESVLGQYAQVQHRYRERTGELLAMGLPDWQPLSLAAQIEPFFMRLPRLLGREGTAGFDVLAPWLLEGCKELERLPLPSTLHHGDLHSGNLLASEGGTRLLDWAGFVAVAHPFCFLSTVFEEHTSTHARSRLLASYLSAWEGYGTRDELHAVVPAAVRLGFFCGALGHAAQMGMASGPWEARNERGNILYCLRMLTRLRNEKEGSTEM
jgi:hypothetical protein